MSSPGDQPTKLLKLPDGPRTIAFRSVVRVVQDDPTLVGVVATWRVRIGDADDYAEPTVNECPLVGMSPVPRPDTTDTESTDMINMAVAIEVFLEGSCIDDALNFWDAVCAALRLHAPYEGTNVGRWLRCNLPRYGDNAAQVSIADYHLTDPAFSPFVPSMANPNDNRAMMSGRGVLTFSFERPR